MTTTTKGTNNTTPNTTTTTTTTATSKPTTPTTTSAPTTSKPTAPTTPTSTTPNHTTPNITSTTSSTPSAVPIYGTSVTIKYNIDNNVTVKLGKTTETLTKGNSTKTVSYSGPEEHIELRLSLTTNIYVLNQINGSNVKEWRTPIVTNTHNTTISIISASLTTTTTTTPDTTPSVTSTTTTTTTTPDTTTTTTPSNIKTVSVTIKHNLISYINVTLGTTKKLIEGNNTTIISYTGNIQGETINFNILSNHNICISGIANDVKQYDRSISVNNTVNDKNYNIISSALTTTPNVTTPSTLSSLSIDYNLNEDVVCNFGDKKFNASGAGHIKLDTYSKPLLTCYSRSLFYVNNMSYNGYYSYLFNTGSSNYITLTSYFSDVNKPILPPKQENKFTNIYTLYNNSNYSNTNILVNIKNTDKVNSKLHSFNVVKVTKLNITNDVNDKINSNSPNGKLCNLECKFYYNNSLTSISTYKHLKWELIDSSQAISLKPNSENNLICELYKSGTILKNTSIKIKVTDLITKLVTYNTINII